MTYTVDDDGTLVPDQLDIYILLDTIDPAVIQRFFDTYLTDFKELTDIYEFSTQGAEVEFETSDYRQMLDFLLRRGGGDFRFYFRNTGPDDVESVVLFFNTDNTLTLGLGVPSELGEQYTEEFTQQFPSPWVLRLYEIPPPDNAKKFKEWVESDFDPFA